MRKGIIAIVALLAGAGLAVPLSSSGQSPAATTTVVTTCPPGQGAPYCEITTVTTTTPTATTTTTTPPPTTTTSTSPSENPPAEPVAGQTVVAGEVRGTVLVRIAGTGRFVEVVPGQPIPLGSEIDATNGSIELTSAPDANGNVQKAVFFGGTFKVTQFRDTGARGRASAAAARLTTRLTLVDRKPADCGRASTRAKKQPPHLWGNGKGRFQTKGAYSAATVTGTKWYVANRCDGTYTRVARGVVSVRDHTKHKTVAVRAPHTYLARPPQPKKPKKPKKKP
jgi:hypothetical protein